MAKDIPKPKEEMKADVLKIKEQTKQQMKSFRDSLENDLRNEIRQLKNEQLQMTESLDFAFTSLEEHKKRLDDVITKNMDLESQNAALRAECKCLESKGSDIETRLVLAEQYSRKANLEIQGILKEDNESVINIVSRIDSAISEEILAGDIEICHRVSSRDSGRSNIIVHSTSLRLSNEDVGLTSEKCQLCE